MPIERFGIQRGREYGHSSDTRVLAHTAFGTPVNATGPMNSNQPGTKQAGLLSTAPYVDPKTQTKKRVCTGKEGCKGSPMKGIEPALCVGHARSLGLVGNAQNQWTKAKAEAEQE